MKGVGARTGTPAHVAAMAGGLAAFALAGAWAWTGWPAGDLDRAVAHAVAGMRAPGLDRAAVLVTMLGDADFLVWPMAATVAVLAILGRRRTALDALALFLAAPAIVMGLKLAIGRARPASAYALPDSFAFPSGHATGGALMLGVLAALYLADRRDASVGTRATAWGIAALGALGIAASRVWLAAHWPSDVLAGLALATVLVGWFAGRVRAERAASGATPEPLLGPLLVAGYLVLWGLHVHARLDATLALYAVGAA